MVLIETIKEVIQRDCVTRNSITGCIEWTGSTYGGGYGAVKVGGKKRPAHRFVYETIHGPISPDLMACHSCDNRKCVNPEHIFVGTPTDNQVDCQQKGRRRHLRGDAHGRAKLNELQVRIIRRSDLRQQELADIFGVTQACISRIKAGKIRAHKSVD